jgi:hypothetical protein
MVSHVFIVSIGTEAETGTETGKRTTTGSEGAGMLGAGMFSVDWCNLHCSFPHTSPFLFPDFNIVEQDTTGVDTTGAETTGVDTIGTDTTCTETTGVDTTFVTETAMCILQATFPHASPLRLPDLRIVSHVIAIEKYLG